MSAAQPFIVKGGGQRVLRKRRQDAIAYANTMSAAYGCRFWVTLEGLGLIYYAFGERLYTRSARR